MGLECADMVPNIFCEAQEGGGRVDIGGDAEIGLFDRYQLEYVARQRWGFGNVGAGRVGE